ncbi:MAG: hypothetical protein WBY94_21575 [Polyangiaceae bacterium]
MASLKRVIVAPTFAQPFQPDYSFVNGGKAPPGTCTLLDSVVCK